MDEIECILVLASLVAILITCTAILIALDQRNLKLQANITDLKSQNAEYEDEVRRYRAGFIEESAKNIEVKRNVQRFGSIDRPPCVMEYNPDGKRLNW